MINRIYRLCYCIIEFIKLVAKTQESAWQSVIFYPFSSICFFRFFVYFLFSLKTENTQEVFVKQKVIIFNAMSQKTYAIHSTCIPVCTVKVKVIW